MEITTYDLSAYNLYSVPILLNGEAYNLQVAYEFDTEEWSILGATRVWTPPAWPARSGGC